MKLHTIDTGLFKLDGGAMFGVVPKQMWKRLNEPDENNMCTWAMRCLLIEEGERKILIDTGIGDKQDAKFRSHFSPHGDDSLLLSLATKGFAPEDITDVLLTHMHFDHVGGAVYRDEKDNLLPTFPNATYWTNKKHLDWALEPNPRERASFLKENIVPLVYTADLMPSHGHVGLPYVMAYDIRPLDTMRERAELYEKVIGTDHFIYFEHDKEVALGQLLKNEKGRVAFGGEVSLDSITA